MSEQIAGGSLVDAERELTAGSARRASEMALSAMQAATTPRARADAALVAGRALLLSGSVEVGRGLLLSEAADAEPVNPAAAALMWAHVAAVTLQSGQVPPAQEMAERAVRNAGCGEDRVRVLCAATLGATLVAGSRTGFGGRALPDVDQVLGVVVPGSDSWLLAMTMGLALIWAEGYEPARSLLVGLEARNRSERSWSALPAVLLALAVLDHRLGRWEAARRAADEALDLCGPAEQATTQPFVTAELATVEAVLGRADACRSRSLSLLDSPAGTHPSIRCAALSALGLLELGLGRFEAAAHWYEVLAAAQPAPERPSPGVMLWEADLVEAYIALERTEQAYRTLERLEARGQMASHGRAAAAVIRCRAALTSDPAEAEALFCQALDHYPAPVWTFARARTQMAMAEHCIRIGDSDRAGPLLLLAAEGFEGIGAAAWAARASNKVAALAGDSAGPTVREAKGSVTAGMGSGSLAPARVPVHIKMLGEFRVEVDGQARESGDGVTAQAVKSVALAGKVPVEELVDQLWPDADIDVGRARFRSLMARIRRQFGPIVERHGSWVVLAEGVTVDVGIFERMAQEAQKAGAAGDGEAGELAQQAAELYRGELLPTDRHLDFTTGPRERLRRRYLAVVGLAADIACRRQLLETAVRHLENALAVEPYDENLYLKAARILAEGGRTSEALSITRRAESALRELGVPLSPEIRELQAKLRRL
ncbi:bacterial transcriptional activator domain-containing protein [Acidiferrimicrobium sp. IK]|uniref:AfsR/SARP family transcriptional regulator n=1 Tax=Acidiferrimicrobium sp. IK TaxID=2871700 RepID=UPI0021CAFBEE|nr:bacterial transcriptional activator domain-containing protein [Acidiferrimicrobium sp. IK]MCU4183300.1 bacterial transcriptional activator domain-containing protein [Acidiferrimicrobium sp. IK]